MTDGLVADIRRFILSYGDHDTDCAGYAAAGPAVLDADACSCGFIARMNELLAAVQDRLAGSSR